MTDDQNADQRAFWSEEPGQNWARHQSVMDAQLSSVLDLLLGIVVPGEGERVLDIGCGAGASSRAVARRLGPAGRVTGLDISDPLLARAKDIGTPDGAAPCTYIQGDAQVWSDNEALFDVALSRFGVMFFSDTAAAFANIARLLRPGGRVAFATWSGPADNPLFSLPSRIATEILGPPATPFDPQAPGPMALADVDRVAPMLGAAGLTAVTADSIHTDLPIPGGRQTMRDVALSIGPLKRRLADAGATEGQTDDVLHAVDDAWALYEEPDGSLRIPARIVLYRGRKP